MTLTEWSGISTGLRQPRANLHRNGNLTFRSLYHVEAPGRSLHRRLLLWEPARGRRGQHESAIARAFHVTRHCRACETGHQRLGGFALLAKKGEEALVKSGRAVSPVRMLAQQGTNAGTIEENGAVAAEFKYTAAVSVHNRGALQDVLAETGGVTGSLPDSSKCWTRLFCMTSFSTGRLLQ